ncbi:TPA: sel1 repeat family protein [Klebsiella pneumoniae]|nr:sel1 repeat family protein [Klebsiella pneumoniae]
MRQLILFLSLMACLLHSASSAKKDLFVNPLSDTHAALAFTCAHQIIPEASADTDVLFKYARWLQKNNLLKQDKSVDAQTERLYRIAAENGHYKASINLQNGALRGQFSLSSHEQFRLSQQLIAAGVATGYYLTAIYLERGVAGLQQDPALALRYYRKAADEGNPQAQAYVGDKLAPVDRAPDIAHQMRRCAAEQGEGKAAVMLGVNLQGKGYYRRAIEAFQLGVAAGDTSSALALSHGFDGPESSDELYYLAQQKDPERARRYKLITKILSNYSYASPTVPEINDIVPLPEWDGKLKWLEEWEANIPPPAPDAALIEKLAQAKQLNPATGRPLPTSPDFEKDSVARLQCRSGEPCPQSGYWQPAWRPREGMSEHAIRYFREGDIMPVEKVTFVRPRPWPLRDRLVVEAQETVWRRVSEA